MEAPYVRIDPILQAFAERHALAVLKNYRDADRSLRFNDSLSRAIWVNASAGAGDGVTYDISVLAHQDRPERFIKGAHVARQVPIAELTGALERAVELVSSWSLDDLQRTSPQKTTGRFWSFVKSVLDPREFFDPFHVERPRAMKEDRISRYADGRPHLPEYTESLAYYQAMYGAFLASSAQRLPKRDGDLAWRQRVHGTYGLIARGAESIPYALRLLRDASPDAREDAATILREVGPAPAAADALLEALAGEADPVTLTAIIECLGTTRSRRALEALQNLSSRSSIDVDMRASLERSIARLRRKQA